MRRQDKLLHMEAIEETGLFPAPLFFSLDDAPLFRYSEPMPREKIILNPEDIIEAAYEIIDTEGYGGFSARKLGAKLHVAHMTVYNYFSRDDILGAVIDRGFGEIYKLTDRVISEHLQHKSEPVEIFLIIADKLLEFAKEHPHLYKYMFQGEHENIETKPETRKHYSSATDKLVKSLPDADQTELRQDSYIYLMLINSLIISVLSKRHTMDEERYNYYSKRSFEMILGQYRLTPVK